MKQRHSIEEQVVALEVAAYMREHGVTMEKAYEDKLVKKEMQMTEDEIKNILSDVLSI